MQQCPKAFANIFIQTQSLSVLGEDRNANWSKMQWSEGSVGGPGGGWVKSIFEIDKSLESKTLKVYGKMKGPQIFHLFTYRPQTTISNGSDITEKIKVYLWTEDTAILKSSFPTIAHLSKTFLTNRR